MNITFYAVRVIALLALVPVSASASQGHAVGHSVIRMLSESACRVIEKQNIDYGRGYHIEVHATYYSGRQLSTKSFGKDKDHAVARFLCKYEAQEMKSFTYKKIK